MNYRMEISYDGSRYKGWQRLGSSKETVQEKIETVLSLYAEKKVTIDGSGRTDAGVHAKAQVASFSLKRSADPLEIKDYLNRYLPDDIAVDMVVIADEKFHARYNAKSKVYYYQIYNSDVINPFKRKYSLFTNQDLRIDRMEKAAQAFVGEHDFTAFTTAKSKKKSFVRTIDRIDFEINGPEIRIEIEGNGFLHNMVRIIVGTLLEVGLGKMKTADIIKTLKNGDRAGTGPTAPAQGLFLKEVKY